jgi:formiminoglutamase
LFIPIESSLFFTKNDPNDLRLGDVFKNYDEKNGANDFLIFGYPDDEGIKLNGGRSGAALAPNLIRKFLYKMTLPENYFTDKKMATQKFIDYGNFDNSGDLFSRHEKIKQTLDHSYRQKTKNISLGGGHDYGYPDGAAFIKNNFLPRQKKPLIINFDAHLDVRPDIHNLNSGTPFYRLLKEFKNQFNLLEIGLQPHCNSVHHWNWAKDQGVETISLTDIEQSNWSIVWQNKMIQELDPTTPVFISFDIDALTASEAGGCSQAWATGLKTSDCLHFLRQLYKKANARGLGIYEVSPPLDRDFQTSKTAALIAYQFIFNS